MPRRALAGAVMLLCTVSLAGCTDKPPPPAPPTSVPFIATFDQQDPGLQPRGLGLVYGNWTVEADGSAPTVPNALRSVHAGVGFNMAIAPYSYQNANLTVQVRAADNRPAQGVGLVVWYQDPSTFDVLQLDLRNGTAAYVRQQGAIVRTLAEGNLTANASALWHEVRVERWRGDLNATYDQAPVLRFHVGLQEAGGAGLWVGRESTALFDNLILSPEGVPEIRVPQLPVNWTELAGEGNATG